ncbi:hypothetical protein M0R45_002030 [Rubus argutus]|uniref:Uncharacterized protein n=1 Tax=Rubus argutus TaxID=59490 RepID=A0AAW1VFZ0_RUBAR
MFRNCNSAVSTQGTKIASEGLKHRVFETSPGDLQGDEDLLAQSSQIRQICHKMTEIMVNRATSCDLKDLVCKFIAESIGKEIEKATTSIYPLHNVFIRMIKILKAPKFDLGKLMEICGVVRGLCFKTLLAFGKTYIQVIVGG